MTVKLRMDAATASQVFRVLDHHDARLESLRRQRRELMRRLAAAVDRRAGDNELNALIAHWLHLQAKRRELRHERWQALRGLLSTEQQAQLLALLPRLE